MHRQGVEDFVGDDDGVDALRQTIQPFNARHMLRHARPQSLLLPFAQIGADLEDAVALRQPAQGGEFFKQHGGERAAAGAEFDDVGNTLRQQFGELACQRAAEQRRQFRRSDKITCRAELAAAGAVITQARRIQREFHVARETDPAVIASDFGIDQRLKLLTDRQGIGRRLWQRVILLRKSHGGIIR